jgi:hypothetical protein
MATPKTKIDGGSAWRWYTQPHPDRQYLAMATVIELRSVWNLPRFEWHTRQVHRQLAHTPGLLGFSFKAQFPLRYWTLSAWTDGKALHAFIHGDGHQAAMTRIAPTMRSFDHTHWKLPGTALPLRWDDGLARLDGRLPLK